MLNEKQKVICKKYSAPDSNGKVKCNKCPLRIRWLECRAFMHYDRHLREWVPDKDVEENV